MSERPRVQAPTAEEIQRRFRHPLVHVARPVILGGLGRGEGQNARVLAEIVRVLYHIEAERFSGKGAVGQPLDEGMGEHCFINGLSS